MDSVNACFLLACPEGTQRSFSDLISTTDGLLTFIFSSIFLVIIVLGIWYVIRAAVKIIRQGEDPSKVQEGYNMIKAVFIGIAMIFVGIIGLIFVLAFFGSLDVFNQGNPEVPDEIPDELNEFFR